MSYSFNDDTPIYTQIIEHIKMQIIGKKYLPKQKIPSVRELSYEYQVNPNTVQKALSELENMGLIKRSYGGAEIRKDNVNTPIELRLQKNHKAKDAIARKAAEFIYDNETVFIDACVRTK